MALLSTLIVAMFAGTATMMEWRVTAVQRQLGDRMELFNQQMNNLNRRIERLER